MQVVALDKISAARRQLVTAINLHFNADDPVSVYSLASNAWEIIDALCTQANISSFSDDTRDHVPQSKDLKRDFVNSPYRNFFKHADRDPEAVIEGFSALACDHILYLAAEDYLRLRKRAPIEVQVYQLWYLALYPGKVRPPDLTRVLEPIECVLPGIHAKRRDEQVDMGKALLSTARLDTQLASHPQTELSL